jgi:hypothetical protein
MSDTSDHVTPPAEERQYLRRNLRRLVIGREIGPRTPRWRTAWKRTLFSYTNRLRRLESETREKEPAP